MAAVSRMSNPERVVITAVLAGVLRIDDQGRVWRNTKRRDFPRPVIDLSRPVSAALAAS